MCNNKLYCQFCGKLCKNRNSLVQHEIRCKKNPNRIKLTLNTGKCYKFINGIKVPHNKNKVCVTNGVVNKFVDKELLNIFLNKNNDWYKGSAQKGKISNNSGIASTPELELKRREKISRTMKLNKNAGGKRHGSGRGKKGYYNGIFCDSSWELAYVAYHIDNNIDIKRCEERRKYIFNNKEHIYIPDFVVGSEIIEIKGYSTKAWQAKLKYNPDIKVLYYQEVKFYIDYVEEKYGNNWINILYNKGE